MNETWWVSESQLDEKQKHIISLPLEKAHLIVGPPGSGKTNLLVLRGKYRTLAQRPNFKLIVFTRALREFIVAGTKNYGIAEDKIQTSHAFFREVLRECGVMPLNDEDFSKQRRLLVDQVAGVVQDRNMTPIFDEILLDEAHDYLPEEVELFAKLAKTIFAVVDRRQKIYSGEEPFSVLESLVDGKTELTHHYRNGLNICKMADNVGKYKAEFEKIAPSCNYDEDQRPSTIEHQQCSSLSEEIESVISKLDAQIKAYPNELIGIISPSKSVVQQIWHQIYQSSFADVASLHSETEPLNLNKDIRICISTLHAAKGLEYRVLHVLSCEHFANRPLPRSLAFTAVTRAKTSLYLYSSDSLLGFLEEAIMALNPSVNLPTTDQLFS